MGQQQLLLVILVTILVGIATVVALNVFGTAAESGNRDAVRQDLIQGASAAQAIWARPRALGGVQGVFNDVATVPNADFGRLVGIPGSVDGLVITNENAVYTVARTGADILTISAVPVTYGENMSIRIERLDEPVAGSSWWVQLTDDGATAPIDLSGADPD